LSRPDTKAIKARADAATEGPWELQYGGRIGTAGARYGSNLNGMHVADVRGWGYLTGRGACAMPDGDAAAIQDANGAFIAAARTDVPELCARVEELEKALRRVEPVLDRCVSAACAKAPPDYAETADALGDVRAALEGTPK
jgi:hypothetical protein